jgi:leucyl/phenylalanyl-tRNA--protein transferase
MPIYQLPDRLPVFPHPLAAHESGVLAIGGDLTPDRLRLAYAYGIFPWYNEEQPLLWWFPDPRCVLFPDKLKVSKSLRSKLQKEEFSVTLDQCFDRVIMRCREIPRKDQEGTWIHPEIAVAYMELHRVGLAHSVEVWQDGDLCGGLYGVSLGRIFFGESMFSDASDASKVALFHLVSLLKQRGFTLIDCQQDTPHLRSLGAELISAPEFYHSYIVPNQRDILSGTGY